uniref:Uncharacterized protein n=1 Tax=Arundo donax TaxID=35708 RepID=A0A0A9BC24_ARUDO
MTNTSPAIDFTCAYLNKGDNSILYEIANLKCIESQIRSKHYQESGTMCKLRAHAGTRHYLVLMHVDLWKARDNYQE